MVLGVITRSIATVVIAMVSVVTVITEKGSAQEGKEQYKNEGGYRTGGCLR